MEDQKKVQTDNVLEQVSGGSVIRTVSNATPIGSSLFWFGFTSGVALSFLLAFFTLSALVSKMDINVRSGVEKTDTDIQMPEIVDQEEPEKPKEISVTPVTKDDWMKGNKNAPVTIIEYSDIDCPFCKKFHPTVQQIVDDYKGKVNWVYRHFPLSSLHPDAQKKAEASECVGSLGGNNAFWTFLDRITTGNLSVDNLAQVAMESGVNKTKFQTCLESGKFAVHVQSDMDSGAKAGASGTPYSIIVSGDKKIPVSGATGAANLKAIIDPLLK